MACENIRSDHIGVLLEVYQKVELNSVTSEKYLISKANWDIWRNCTEEKYKAWNEANLQYDSIDDMTEAFISDFIWDFGKLPFPTHLGKYLIKIGKIRAKIHGIGKIKAIFGLGMTPINGLKNGQIKSLFMDIYTECMVEAVPRIELKSQNRRKKTPWWNKDVANAKCKVNKAKKSFRRRRTPYNFENLKNCENALEEVKENAKAEWTKVVCDKITYASSSKEMWESFNTLTSYQDYNGGGVIPLLDDDGSPVFNREDKCLILENVFFGGRHLNNCSFDESFKKEVEKELNTDTQNTIQNKDAEELLNYDITLSEVEAVIQHLKRNKSPGLMRYTQKCYRMLVKNL